MPTYNTPNSTQTYAVPSGVDLLYLRVVGARGVDGQDGDNNSTGGAGGQAGEATGLLSVASGETLTAQIAGQPSSPYFSGGVGGKSGETTSSGDEIQADGGDGGGASALIRDSDSMTLAIGDGGGGGGAGDPDGSSFVGGGGGGGARGGLGGDPNGADASGTGSGGDGGDGSAAAFNNGSPGGVGGATVAGIVSDATTQSGVWGATGEVEIVEIPPAPADLAVLPGPSSLSLSWSDGDYETDYRITVDGSITATLAANTDSHTITGLQEGTTYQIGVEAYQSDADAGRTSTTTATTVLPRPTSLEVVETRLREVDLAWTLQSTDETRVDILTSTDDGASWSVATQLPPGTESATLTGLLDGTDYRFGLDIVGNDVTERRVLF